MEHVCTLDKFMPLVAEMPMCEDEAKTLFYVAAALAEPRDKFTHADAQSYWKQCKGKR